MRRIPPPFVAQLAKRPHGRLIRNDQSGGIRRTPNASRYSVATWPRCALFTLNTDGSREELTRSDAMAVAAVSSPTRLQCAEDNLRKPQASSDSSPQSF